MDNLRREDLLKPSSEIFVPPYPRTSRRLPLNISLEKSFHLPESQCAVQPAIPCMTACVAADWPRQKRYPAPQQGKRMQLDQLKRREFITLLGGAAVAWPFAARAQQAAMRVIGYLSSRSATSDVPMLDAFRRGLKEEGYVVGQNVTMEYRWAAGQYDRLPALAEDLVRRQVAVIATAGGEPAALAAKAATAKIPIVFNVGDDPVRVGLVASLNKPGGNATGVTSLLGAQVAKQFGLLCDLVPKAAVIAMLVDVNYPWAGSQISNTEAAAGAHGRQLVVLKAGSEHDLDV